MATATATESVTLVVSKLKSALSHAGKVVIKNHAKPILSGIVIGPDSLGDVSVQAIGTEAWVRVVMPGVEWPDGMEPQWLQLDRLSKICSVITSETLTISTTATGVKIKSDGYSVNLQTANAKEYPSLPLPSQNSVLVNAAKLRILLERTAFCTEVDSARYALGAVKIESVPDHKRLLAVGTDGRRLSYAEAWSCIDEPLSNQLSILCPQSIVRILTPWIDPADTDAVVRVHWDPNRVHFVCGDLTIGAVLVEGRFPSWDKILQSVGSEECRVELIAGVYRARVEQASVLVDSESRGITHTFENGYLSLKCQTADVGETDVSTPIDWERKKRVELMDFRFVLDFAKRLPPEEAIKLRLYGENQAVEFSVEGWRYIVMPMITDGK